jgi:hypothetical protein
VLRRTVRTTTRWVRSCQSLNILIPYLSFKCHLTCNKWLIWTLALCHDAILKRSIVVAKVKLWPAP